MQQSLCSGADGQCVVSLVSGGFQESAVPEPPPLHWVCVCVCACALIGCCTCLTVPFIPLSCTHYGPVCVAQVELLSVTDKSVWVIVCVREWKTESVGGLKDSLANCHIHLWLPFSFPQCHYTFFINNSNQRDCPRPCPALWHVSLWSPHAHSHMHILTNSTSQECVNPTQTSSLMHMEH